MLIRKNEQDFNLNKLAIGDIFSAKNLSEIKENTINEYHIILII